MVELVIRRRRKQTQYYTEVLGDGVGLDMVLVPGGRFQMGSPADEPERLDNEGPQHEVVVPALFVGRYPVTQAQWRIVAAWSRVERELEADPSYFEGDERPVERVSWDDAVEFCARLVQKSGRAYRLPSEAEWEYVCRAGTTTPFHFGETIMPELANYRCSFAYGDGPTGEARGETTPVGTFPANDFGLCDMHGNVLEWCLDSWYESYEGAPTDGSAWIRDDNDNDSQVVRGGSWDYFSRACRSAVRYRYLRDVADIFIGFRVVCVAP